MRIGGLSSSFQPLGYVDTSIGKLAVFGTSGAADEEVTRKSSQSVKTVPPQELVNRLLPYIAHPADSLGEDCEKPKQPSLSEEQIKVLTAEDVETMLGVFIAGQKNLTHKLETRVLTNEKGEKVHSIEYTEVEHPRGEGESNVDYLHRLHLLNEEKTKQQMQEIFGKSLAAARFSSGINDEIMKTLKMGDSMSKAFEAVRSNPFANIKAKLPNIDGRKLKNLTADIPSLGYSHSGPDVARLAESIHEARLAPFNALNERLDKLVALAADSGSFMVQMNETQTAIASEIKASGEAASKIGKDSLKVTRWGFWLTIVVVLLAVIGIGLSLLDRSSADADARHFREQAGQVVTGISGLTETIKQNQAQWATNINAVLDQMQKASDAQDKHVRAMLDGQAALIQQQQADHAKDLATIEELRAKLDALEVRLEASDQPQDPAREGE